MAKILKALIGICVVCLVPAVILGQPAKIKKEIKPEPEIPTPATEMTTPTEETEMAAPTEETATPTEKITPKTKIKEKLETIETKKETITQKIRGSFEKARKTLEEKQAQIQKKIQTQKEILVKRLAKISEQKKNIIERIYERVNELNKRITDYYLDVLEKLGEILAKIESRAEKFKAQGANTNEVEKCVGNAKTKIEKAKDAVLAQAQKVYSAPQVTTEKNLKLNVGAIRKQLYYDLKAVEKSVKDARSAVQNCAVLLGKAAETKQKPATTTPATPTPATPTLP